MIKHTGLIEKCKKNDPKAQFKLYELYSKAMYNTSLRIVKNKEDAEDIIQEAFIQAFKHMKSFRYESSLGSWLKQIVINKSIDMLKNRRQNILINEYSMFPASEEISSDDENKREYINQIYKAFYQLTDGYRIIFSLYLFEGYDHTEIAQILNISSSTSKSQYSRAKNKIRKYMYESCPSLETKIQIV